MNKINKNEVVGKRVYDYALQLLQEEIYDLSDSFSNEEIAKTASNLAMALVGRGINRELVVVQTTVSLFALGLTWRANSYRNGSWVSVSDNISTGVGRSMVAIISDPFEIEADEVQYLIEMMNEAWCSMKEEL